MTQKPLTVLIVDDEPIERSILEDKLSDAGYKVVAASSPREAEPLWTNSQFDVILTDLRMPGQDGLTFLREIKTKRPTQNVIVMTAYGSVRTAVAAMKLGVYDYIEKPFATDELLLILDRLFRDRQAGVVSGIDYAEGRPPRAVAKIVGTSAAIRGVLAAVRAVADTDSNVLICGESGTGKELTARVIHETSRRNAGPLVAVSCAALPQNLLESELFGHERGSFTGAGKRRLGRFELAHRGTLFLDDVDDITRVGQVKLVRVLEERCFERVGGETPVRVDVRVIAGTKKSLANLVAAGKFREDLFYRLNVVPINIPPLRERAEDVPLLVEYFVPIICAKLGRPDPRFTAAALNELQKYEWPGNVRELKHLLERLLILNRGERVTREDIVKLIAGTHAAPSVMHPHPGTSEVNIKATLADVEKRLLNWAMEKSGGNLACAARVLNIPRSTLQYKLTKYGFDFRR